MIKFLLPKNQTDVISEFKMVLKKMFEQVEIVEPGETKNIHKDVKAESPDIILLPAFLINDKADELCQNLKSDENTRVIPVLLLTDNQNDTKIRNKALQAGADAFLSLPADEVEVKMQIDNLLKIRHYNSKYNGDVETENRKQYKLLFEAASDFVFLHHFDNKKGAGKIVDVSDITLERLGYSREELYTKRPVDLTADVNLEISDESKKLASSGKLKFEKTLITKSGDYIPVEIQAKVVNIQGEKMVLSIGRDITERKKAMESLKRSETRFYNLFKSVPVPQFYWSFDEEKFVLKEVNKAALELTRGKASDFIGKSAKEIYPDRPDLLERFHFCIKNRRNIVYETDYVARGTGLSRIIIFTFAYVSDDLILLHTEDITERKQTELKLKESEEKFRSLISEMNHGLAVHEAVFDSHGKMTDYRFIDFNDSFEKHTGLKRKDTIGKTATDILTEDKNFWIDKYEKVVKNGEVVHFEEYAKQFGKYYEVVAYRNRENQFATVISDITERKKNIRELNMHNARLEALTKIFKYEAEDIADILKYTLEQAVALTSSKMGYIFSFDEQHKKFTLHAWSGDVAKECEVENQKKVYTLEDVGCWGEAVRQRKPYIINDYSAPNKYKRGTPGKHKVLKKFLTVPLILDNQIKAVIGVANKKEDYTEKDIKQLSLLMDALWKIVERKQHIEELKAAKEKAEESDRLKSAFLANMSHEIRTPMNGIFGFVDMLKEQDISANEKANYMELIKKSGDRMLNTIDKLVDISKIEAKQVEVLSTEFNVNEQIDELAKYFQPEIVSKGLNFLTSKSLPHHKAIIETDKEKLNAVFMNLIKNAIVYTNEGTIEFGYRVKGQWLQFFVKDTGIGIEEERQEAIFDHFVQADLSLSKPYEGVGLGLSIAKAYVEIIGGKIKLKSQKGKGSEFYFNLLNNGEMEHLDAEPASKNDIRPDNGKLKDLTILVAEDDEVGRLYLKQLLEGKCKKVLYARNGKEAVEIYQQNNQINLVLMDIKMPVMDGYSATIKIKAINPDAVIVAQTAYALSGDREKAIAAGCNDYLTKPLAKDILMNAIEKHLSK